jgi:hypothetical protein
MRGRLNLKTEEGTTKFAKFHQKSGDSGLRWVHYFEEAA